MLLRLPYLALTGVFAFLRLLPTNSTDKDIEILALRHQLTVLQRQVGKPRLTPPDRAFLAALLDFVRRRNRDGASDADAVAALIDVLRVPVPPAGGRAMHEPAPR